MANSNNRPLGFLENLKSLESSSSSSSVSSASQSSSENCLQRCWSNSCPCSRGHLAVPCALGCSLLLLSLCDPVQPILLGADPGTELLRAGEGAGCSAGKMGCVRVSLLAQAFLPALCTQESQPEQPTALPALLSPFPPSFVTNSAWPWPNCGPLFLQQQIPG